MKAVSRIVLAGFLCLAGAVSFTGCSNIALPPLLIDLSLGSGFTLQVSQDQTVFPSLVGIFCNLLTEEELDQLLIDAGFEQAAELVNLERVELDNLQFNATAGDFSTFTEAEFMILVGDTAIPIGTAMNPAGLGTNFVIVPDTTIDLLSILNSGQCGGGMLNLRGTAPAAALNYELVAGLAVFTSVNL